MYFVEVYWLTMFQVHSKVIQLYIDTYVYYTYTHIHTYSLFSIVDYYKILTLFPYAI